MYIYVNVIVKIYTLQTSYILEMYTENLWDVLPRSSFGNERFILPAARNDARVWPFWGIALLKVTTSSKGSLHPVIRV